MSFAHVADNSVWAAAVTSVYASAYFTLATGDLLVAYASLGGADQVMTLTDDRALNPFTFKAHANNGGNFYSAFAVLAAPVAGSSLFNLSVPSSASWLSLCFVQFTPTSTPTFDVGPSSGTGASTPVVSGNITTNGTDELVFGGGARDSTAGLYSSELIAGGAADGVATDSNHGAIWWKAFAATQSGINAQSTIAAGTWIGDIIAYRIGGAGGGANRVQQAQWWGQ
jgi:hypothetical protein